MWIAALWVVVSLLAAGPVSWLAAGLASLTHMPAVSTSRVFVGVVDALVYVVLSFGVFAPTGRYRPPVWYVFAALGAYPAIPAVGGMALNSPLFPSATIHLGNGKILKIEGEGASASNPYVQSLVVNGKPSERTWITFETLSKGATLEFKLGNTPNKEWGTRPEDAPPSFEDGAPPSGK